MSLKHFHTIFILFAVLCDLGFFVWSRIEHEAAERLGVTHLAMFSGWLSLLLAIYGVWYVVKKSKSIIV